MATKTKKKTPRAVKRQQQVAAESFLRFEPERQSLRERLAGAGSERDRQYRAADTSAEGIKTAAGKAKGELGDIYGGVIADQAPQRAALDAELAPVQGAGSTLLRAAITGEREGGTRRLRESLARAQGETTARALDAESGRVYARRSADERYGSDRARIEDAGRSLDARQGAFETGRISSLENADRSLDAARAREIRRQRAQDARQEDQQDFQAGENQKNRDARQKSGAKKKRATPQQQGELEDRVGSAREAIRPYKNLGAAQIKALFENGSPASEKVDEKLYDKYVSQGMDAGTAKRRATKKLAAVPKIGGLTLQIAIDLETKGYITKATLQKIHDRKYAAKPIGPTRPKKTVGEPISGVKVPARPFG